MAVDSSTTDAIQQALQDVEHLVREEPTQEEPQPTKEVGVPFLHEEDGAELSDADQPIDLQQLLKDTTYVGEVPYTTITESITSQFEDYIGTDDSTDYVDIFYDQLHSSYQQMEDEDEYHDQKREILNDLQDQFISFMATEFEQRLGITITSVEEEDIRYEEIEDILRECYTYFILSARENFMTAITKDLAPHLTVTEDDNDSSLQEIQTLLLRYSPIITTLTPTQFLQLTDGEAIQGFYEEDAIVGNFLKKYALKLYQYPEFEVKLINNISLASMPELADSQPEG